MGYYIRLLIVGILLSSCTAEDSLYIEPIPPTLEIDGRLPLDENGYYHLDLNDSSNQTIHTITGTVGPTTEPIKVDWTSNLSRVFQDNLVSTINCCSYPNDDGVIHTVIAPIRDMMGDTMVVSATIQQFQIIKTINIVLE